MPKHHNLFFTLAAKRCSFPSLYGVCYTTPALNNTLAVQIHDSAKHFHDSSKLCFSQALLVNAKTFQDLALSPLHDAISPRILAFACRISAFTKPISALALRFITRPMRFYTLQCLCLTGLVISLPRLYSTNFSLLFHCFASQCFTLPSQI